MKVIGLGDFAKIFLSQIAPTQMVNFPTQIPSCDFHSAALLHLFISFEPCICPIVAFYPFENSDSDVVSVSICFTSNTNGDVPCMERYL